MTERGDRQPTSPEQGPLRYSLPIEEVFASLEYSRRFEGGDHGTLPEYLMGLKWLFDEGFPAYRWNNYYDISRLTNESGETGDFWRTPKAVLMADELKADALAEYIDAVAQEVNLNSVFLSEHPELIRLGAADGPYIIAVDSEFQSYNEDNVPRIPPARLVAYTKDGVALDASEPLKLFVDGRGLASTQEEAIKQYYRVMEAAPFAILDEEKED